jgi:hypothetical protein
VSRFSEESSVKVEERGGGFVAECEDCCGGTGSFHTREAAINEWNKVARLVFLGSGMRNVAAPSVEQETKASVSVLESGSDYIDFKKHLADDLRQFSSDADYSSLDALQLLAAVRCLGRKAMSGSDTKRLRKALGDLLDWIAMAPSGQCYGRGLHKVVGQAQAAMGAYHV